MFINLNKFIFLFTGIHFILSSFTFCAIRKETTSLVTYQQIRPTKNKEKVKINVFIPTEAGWESFEQILKKGLPLATNVSNEMKETMGKAFPFVKEDYKLFFKSFKNNFKITAENKLIFNKFFSKFIFGFAALSPSYQALCIENPDENYCKDHFDSEFKPFLETLLPVISTLIETAEYFSIPITYNNDARVKVGVILAEENILGFGLGFYIDSENDKIPFVYRQQSPIFYPAIPWKKRIGDVQEHDFTFLNGSLIPTQSSGFRFTYYPSFMNQQGILRQSVEVEKYHGSKGENPYSRSIQCVNIEILKSLDQDPYLEILPNAFLKHLESEKYAFLSIPEENSFDEKMLQLLITEKLIEELKRDPTLEEVEINQTLESLEFDRRTIESEIISKISENPSEYEKMIEAEWTQRQEAISSGSIYLTQSLSSSATSQKRKNKQQSTHKQPQTQTENKQNHERKILKIFDQLKAQGAQKYRDLVQISEKAKEFFSFKIQSKIHINEVGSHRILHGSSGSFSMVVPHQGDGSLPDYQVNKWLKGLIRFLSNESLTTESPK